MGAGGEEGVWSGIRSGEAGGGGEEEGEEEWRRR